MVREPLSRELECPEGVTYLLHPVSRHLLTLVDVTDIAASADPYVPILQHPGLTPPRRTRLIDEGLSSPKEEVVPEPAPLRLISRARCRHAGGEAGKAEVRVGRVVENSRSMSCTDLSSEASTSGLGYLGPPFSFRASRSRARCAQFGRSLPLIRMARTPTTYYTSSGSSRLGTPSLAANLARRPPAAIRVPGCYSDASIAMRPPSLAWFAIAPRRSPVRAL